VNEVRFGLIGLGLMGREFASAAARWLHLKDLDVRPVITAVCDTDPDAVRWFEDRVPSVAFSTDDYRELLARDDVDAVYCAVPHHLHERIYVDVIQAGKHLLGEKPFGIDRAANRRIQEAIDAHADLLVRCSSEFPFYPGALRIANAIREGRLGTILRVEAGLLHASDLNPDKPINWKRRTETNGAYGCMGDLGMHVLHIPLRNGWQPTRTHAVLTNVMRERPDGRGGTARSDTWDNATLLTEVEHGDGSFPMILRTERIAPGETNTWYLEVLGTERSMAFSTKHPKTLRLLAYERGHEQAWQHLDLGYASAYPTITGGIFEFGFSDALLQMWAAFCDELAHGADGMRQPLQCVTPEEAAASHRVFTDALASQAAGSQGADG
jgi:predicted dehydrogenase